MTASAMLFFLLDRSLAFSMLFFNSAALCYKLVLSSFIWSRSFFARRS